MKKIVFCLMATGLSLTFLPLLSNAQTAEPSSSLAAPKKAETVEIKTMRQDLNETAAQNQSKLKSSGKKDSQQAEVRSQRRYHEHGGVYISVGGGLLILLLIILLL